MDQLEQVLPTLKFPISRGNCQSKPEGSRTRMTKEGKPPEILSFGIIRDINTGNWQPARGTLMYPDVGKLLRDIATEKFPEFTYTNYQINKNVNCKMHVDSKNRGNSYTFTVGQFSEGGGLIVEESIIDIYKKPYMFDGNKIKHGTEDWKGGDRYCIIYFTGPKNNCKELLRSFDILKPIVKSDYLTCNEIFRKNIYQTNRFFKESETWLDIGANIGAFTLACVNAGVKVYAFEPCPRNIKKLISLQDHINFTLYQSAVSNKYGETQLYLDKSNEWRHTLKPIRGRDSINVKMIDAKDLPEADGIKIDAEGSEVEIIYRLSKLPKYLLFEYDGQHNPKCETYNHIMIYLEKHYRNIHTSSTPRLEKDINYFPNGITILCSDLF